MTSSYTIRTLLTASCLVLAATAHAQTSDALFEAGTLQELRLWINSRDLDELRRTFNSNEYYPADMEWGSQRVRSVGVRSRGRGSRNPIKLGLRIDFDRYVDDQKFLGLKSLALDNGWEDPSLIREGVAMALFARMGQPAPRESPARVYINGQYEGLYTIFESVDKAFLSRTLGENDGYLFEYQYVDPFYGEYLGEALEPYATLFKAETHESQPAAVLYSPIHDLFREVNEADTAIWRQSVERFLDLPQFVTHVAIESFTSEIDGILGAWGMNNFYLYRPEAATRHIVIPWDRDNSFQDFESSVLNRVDQNRIVARLLTYPDLRALYLQTLEQCADAAASDGWLEAQVNARASLVEAAALADVKKRYSNEEFNTSIAFLKLFAVNRPGAVRAEVERLRREAPATSEATAAGRARPARVRPR
jgi:spore coat protein CotH